jgi:hypothetical protein
MNVLLYAIGGFLVIDIIGFILVILYLGILKVFGSISNHMNNPRF